MADGDQVAGSKRWRLPPLLGGWSHYNSVPNRAWIGEAVLRCGCLIGRGFDLNAVPLLPNDTIKCPIHGQTTVVSAR